MKWIQRVSLVLGATLISAYFPLASPQDSGSGVVQGAVYQDHEPKVGAKVVVNSSTDSRFEKMVVTNREGHFTVSEVPLGEVQILVYDKNDQLVAQGVGVLTFDGETVTVDIEAVTAEN